MFSSFVSRKSSKLSHTFINKKPELIKSFGFFVFRRFWSIFVKTKLTAYEIA